MPKDFSHTFSFNKFSNFTRRYLFISCSMLILSCFHVSFHIFISGRFPCIPVRLIFFILHVAFSFKYCCDLHVGSSLPIFNSCALLHLFKISFFVSCLFTPTIFIKTLFMLVYACIPSGLVLLSDNIC